MSAITTTQQWQPIDTAPKDGTKVLCFNKDWDIPLVLVYEMHYGVGHKCWCWDGDADEESTPTHWIPLPAPPEDEQ